MKNEKKLRVLFISGELIAGDIAHELKKEGCEVKLFIRDKVAEGCFDGMLEKTNNWRKELDWVGKDGLIVFDDVGYGKDQEILRKKGYLVVGAGIEGEKLEMDREHGQEIMKLLGIETNNDFETKPFTVDSAIEFIKKKKGSWVLKQNDHNTALTYVGDIDDGSDVINILENYKANFGGSSDVSLQKRVKGVEIAMGRFFNGNDWIGPIVFNVEHKHLCNDDIGPLGGETGTLMWYERDENNKFFKKTLARMKEYLKRIDYRGYIDINFIVADEDTIYPLELTSRFGSSTNQTQSEIQKSPWSEILLAIAKGENYEVDYKKGYGITVVLTVAPFPYRTSDKKLSQKGINIYFKKTLSKKDFEHIHFEGVSVKKIGGKDIYLTAGDLGYVLYITGSAETVLEARKKVYVIINKIIIPKMFYRTDIGLRFLNKDQKLLQRWKLI